MSDQKWIKSAAITVTVAGALLALYLLFDVLFAVFLPFLIAFSLAAITHPLAERFAIRLGLSRRAVAAVFTLLTLALVFGLVYVLFSRALIELQNFVSYLIGEQGEGGGRVAAFCERIRTFFAGSPAGLSGLFSWLSHFIEDPETLFAEQARAWLLRLSEGIPQLAMRFAGALPAALLFLLVTVIACFYFSVEYDTLTGVLPCFLPSPWRESAPRLAARVRRKVMQYLRAYLVLFFITLAELIFGLLLLRVRYVLLIALLIALLDFLPIFGVGTVLIPWALFSLIAGNVALGVGLAVLYVIITVIRQIIEPRVVGKSLGIHPVLMLISLYAGLKIFGIIGFFVGPCLALIGKALFVGEGLRS